MSASSSPSVVTVESSSEPETTTDSSSDTSTDSSSTESDVPVASGAAADVPAVPVRQQPRELPGVQAFSLEHPDVHVTRIERSAGFPSGLAVVLRGPWELQGLEPQRYSPVFPFAAEPDALQRRDFAEIGERGSIAECHKLIDFIFDEVVVPTDPINAVNKVLPPNRCAPRRGRNAEKGVPRHHDIH